MLLYTACQNGFLVTLVYLDARDGKFFHQVRSPNSFKLTTLREKQMFKFKLGQHIKSSKKHKNSTRLNFFKSTLEKIQVSIFY